MAAIDEERTQTQQFIEKLRTEGVTESDTNRAEMKWIDRNRQERVSGGWEGERMNETEHQQSINEIIECADTGSSPGTSPGTRVTLFFWNDRRDDGLELFTQCVGLY